MKNNTRNLSIEDNVQVRPEPTNLYRNDIDSSNTVDGKPVIYWIDKHSETVQSNAGYVALINCSDITVKNLVLSHNGQGILLISTPDLQLTQNHITHMDSGIFLYKSSNISVTENELESNDICIKAQGSQATTIASNSLMRSGMGISLVGEAQDSIVSGNTITINTDNGIWLSGISNSTIWHNNVSENSENGITLYHSCNNIVTANSIASNRLDGIGIWEESTGNEISENLIANNNRCGLLIRACGNNTNIIIGNMIEKNNNSAIRFVSGPSNNLICHNNFIENDNNGAQISFGSISDNSILNAWDNGSEGNYWSDYLTKYPNATETDSVGVGNMPYVIGENNKDHYPLLNQVDFSTPLHFPTPIVSPTIEPTAEPTSTPKPQSGFLGTNIPIEYGYAIVAVLVIIIVAGLSLVYIKKFRK
jgi:parallel beta-helix repeat protein